MKKIYIYTCTYTDIYTTYYGGFLKYGYPVYNHHPCQLDCPSQTTVLDTMGGATGSQGTQKLRLLHHDILLILRIIICRYLPVTASALGKQKPPMVISWGIPWTYICIYTYMQNDPLLGF